MLVILAFLMRLIYNLIAPALPFMIGAFVILIIVYIIRHRQGW